MTDDEVADLLDSAKPLVIIEAPAGCGKTYQGASLARRAAEGFSKGRALILTHTHAACAVFAKETKAAHRNVEIRTIDSLLVRIAAAYHKSLKLPADPSTWARQQGESGFQKLGGLVANLVTQQPMIASALSDRYPIVIADEHQDSTTDQHDVVMALHAAGSRLRIFGDPMQRIYGRHTDKAIAADRARWETLKSAGTAGQLSYPHRWKNGSLELGEWILPVKPRPFRH